MLKEVQIGQICHLYVKYIHICVVGRCPSALVDSLQA